MTELGLPGAVAAASAAQARCRPGAAASAPTAAAAPARKCRRLIDPFVSFRFVMGSFLQLVPEVYTVGRAKRREE